MAILGRKKLLALLILFNFIHMYGFGQEKKKISFEEIFSEGYLKAKTIQQLKWMNDGRYFTSLVHSKNDYHIIKFEISSGKAIDTVVSSSQLSLQEISSYEFSPDESKLLIATGETKIYRWSSKANYYIYNISTKQSKSLSQGEKQSYATFSPDGSMIAFVRDNDLFYVNLSDFKEVRLTSTGEWNHIINGSTDWVYEEEFGFTKAFEWAPDSRKIAFYTFDESEVKQYNMQLWGQLYPPDYQFKYPKAGEKNSEITISVYHVGGSTVKIDIGSEKDIYIPRINWTANADLLSIMKLNRLQNKLEIIHADAKSGESNTVITEESKTYVDIEFADDLIYFADNKHLIRSSEQSGFKHYYLYTIEGKLVRQITTGNWEVDQLVGINQDKNILYYTSTEDSPLERQFYSIGIDGKNKKKLTSRKGTHQIDMSPDTKFFVDKYSNANTPFTFSLHAGSTGKLVKLIEDNSQLKKRLENSVFSKKEFFTFKTNQNVELNAYIIKPENFDPNKKYPVLMNVYGGPGSQEVEDIWGASPREYWFRYLAQEGVIVVSVDNRGTGARGREFKHSTYANLGKLEVEDQIDAAKYLSSLPYIDGDRIAIWGWSYGGYMSSLALMLGADYFKAAIAVAPVSSWRFYDTVYTERYLMTPQQNKDGYDNYSPLTHVNKLKGSFYLIHGTGDDNVHFQNSVMLQHALIKAGKEFDSFYYPNENHSFNIHPSSIPHVFKKMTMFVKRELKDSENF